MAENSFRILLDFRELNFKFYKFVWMSISPRELVTIKDLKVALLKKFSFERTDLLLFLRDGLLPEDENISNILRENDSVRLFYTEPPTVVNVNDSRTINYEGDEENPNDDQVKSPKKRKEHSDMSEDKNEQIEFNKKRKHSFSNGTYLYKNNSSSENSALVSAVSDDIENVTSADLYNFDEKNGKSCNIKKKLKYSHDVSQNSVISENEILSSNIIPMSEKSQSKINSCKKKKKHKHSKDVSEREIICQDKIVEMSETNKNEPKFSKKKKKHKHFHDASSMASVSEFAVTFCDETIDTSGKLNDSVNDVETRSELLKLRKSTFGTVADDSEILKLAPISFCASSVSTSSGIGYSLKTSQESNQKISPEENCSKSYVSDSKPFQEIDENNQSVSQGNSCKKKKRKRQRKRKSLLICPQVDVSNDYNLDIKSPQKSESLDSLSMSTYETVVFSPRENETPDNSKSNAFYSERKANCLQTKSSFVDSFGSYLSSTSTPFSETHAAPPRKNVIFKMPSCSNASEDQSCLVTAVNTISSTIQKKVENYPSCSSPCSVTKNENASTPNRNFHEKSLSTKIKNSDKSTDSFSNIGIKSQFLDPSFSYKDCPPLNSCPLAGTHIAFKILELDSSYSPVVSNYKEGIVKAINSETDELDIELIEPEVKEGRIGKFENLYKDELPSCEIIKQVTMSWASLIDPVQVIY